MSLAALKAKETKSKKKIKSKVRILLANPIKPKCPFLEESDFQCLQDFLVEAIKQSNMSGREFATSKHISLGLESSLRTINQRSAGCVILSASIKPRYLLGVLSRNVQVKDKTVPTFVQPQLEDATQKIFNVKTLSLVLPKNSTSLGEQLEAWIERHKRTKKSENIEMFPCTEKRKLLKNKNTSTLDINCEKLKSLSVVTNRGTEKKSEIKPWGSSYISFAAGNQLTLMDGEAESKNDNDVLLDTLNKIANKVKTPSTGAAEISLITPQSEDQEKSMDIPLNENLSDEDDFLPRYIPLTVHKIIPNPNKRPKKKRKKNKSAVKK